MILFFFIACSDQNDWDDIEPSGENWQPTAPRVDDGSVNGSNNYDETDPHEVLVSYIPPTAQTEFLLNSGEENDFGSIDLMSVDPAIVIDFFSLNLFVSLNSDNNYSLGHEGNLYGYEYVSSCRLVLNTDPDCALSDTESMSDDGTIAFDNQIPLGGEFGTRPKIMCQMTEREPLGDTNGFAFDIGDATTITGYSRADNRPVIATIIDDNGGTEPKTAGLLSSVD